MRNTVLLLLSILFFQLSCISTRKNGPSHTVTIERRSSWKALAAKAYKQHIPLRITVHHEGTKLNMDDDAAKKINAIQRWGMGAEKGWADVPYHFFIAPGGAIYEGRDPYTVGETSTEYDPTGHLLICCLGNRETDSVPAAQLQSLLQLIRHSSWKYKIPIDSLGTHKNFSNQTTCPGKYLLTYFENGFIREQLKQNDQTLK